MKHSFKSTVVLSAIGISALLGKPAEAAEPCREIELHSGSATFSGVTAKEESDLTCFQLRVPIGAMAHIRIVSLASRDMAFNIEDVTDNQDHYAFRVEKPAYKISVYKTFRRSPRGGFKLAISIAGGRDVSVSNNRFFAATPRARLAHYVGVWAPTIAACKGGGRDVFRITPKGEEGREWQCDITHASEQAGGWTVRMACAAEGNDYKQTMRWRIDGAGNLHETRGRETKAYVRCGDGDFHAMDSD